MAAYPHEEIPTNQIATECYPTSNRTVHVDNLPRNITYKTLQDLFKKYGEIIKIKINNNPGSMSSAHIEYTDIISAVKAINSIKNKTICIEGRLLSLWFSPPFPTYCIWIGHVSEALDDFDMKSFFYIARIRNILKLVIDHPKERALIYFENPTLAECAIRKLHGAVINSQQIVADFASRQLVKKFYETYVYKKSVQQPLIRLRIPSAEHLTRFGTIMNQEQNTNANEIRNMNGSDASDVLTLQPQGRVTSSFSHLSLKNIGTRCPERSIQSNDVIYMDNEGRTNQNYYIHIYDRRIIRKQFDVFHPYASKILCFFNLDRSINLDYLYYVFCQFGEIINIAIKRTNHYLFHLYFEFYYLKSAIKAINTMNGRIVEQNRMDIHFITVRKNCYVWISELPESISESDLIFNINSRINLSDNISHCAIDRSKQCALLHFNEIGDAERVVNHFRGSSMYNCKLHTGYGSLTFRSKFYSNLKKQNNIIESSFENSNSIAQGFEESLTDFFKSDLGYFSYNLPNTQGAETNLKQESVQHVNDKSRAQKTNVSFDSKNEHTVDSTSTSSGSLLSSNASTSQSSQYHSSNQNLALSNIKDEISSSAYNDYDFSEKYTHKLKKASLQLKSSVDEESIENKVSRQIDNDGYSISLTPTNILITSNVNKKVSIEAYKQMFASFGDIIKWSVSITDSEVYTVYIHYKDIENVQSAINQLSGFAVAGYFIKLDYGVFKDIGESRLTEIKCDSNQKTSDVALLDKPSPIKTEPILSSDLNSPTNNNLSSATDDNCNRDILDEMDSTHAIIEHGHNSQKHDSSKYANTNDGRLPIVNPLLLDLNEEKSTTKQINEQEQLEELTLTNNLNFNENQTITKNVHQMAENGETENSVIKTNPNKTFERFVNTERYSKQESSDTVLLVEPPSIKTEPTLQPNLNGSTDTSLSSAIGNEYNNDTLDKMDKCHTDIKHTTVSDNSHEYYPGGYANTNDGKLPTVNPLLFDDCEEENTIIKQINKQKDLAINCNKNTTINNNVHQMTENKTTKNAIIKTYFNKTLTKKSGGLVNTKRNSNQERSDIVLLDKPLSIKAEPIISSDSSTDKISSSEIDGQYNHILDKVDSTRTKIKHKAVNDNSLKHYPSKYANTNNGRLHTVYSLLLDDWKKEKSKTKKIDDQRQSKELTTTTNLNCSKNKTTNKNTHQKIENKKPKNIIEKMNSNKTTNKNTHQKIENKKPKNIIEKMNSNKTITKQDMAKDPKKFIDLSHTISEKKKHHEPKIIGSKFKKIENAKSNLYEFNMFEITHTNKKDVTTLRNDPIKKIEKKNEHGLMKIPCNKEILIKNNNFKETKQTQDVLKIKDKHNQHPSTQKRLINSLKNNDEKKINKELKIKEENMTIRQTACDKDLNGKKEHENDKRFKQNTSTKLSNKMPTENSPKRKIYDEELKDQTVTNKRKKNNSIFEVVYEPHISMYDRVKARSIKNQKKKKRE